MTPKEIQEKLKDHSPTRVAYYTGLSRVRISQIKHGKAANLTQNTIDKLEKYLKKRG